MAGPGNRHCASCIGTLSFPTVLIGRRVKAKSDEDLTFNFNLRRRSKDALEVNTKKYKKLGAVVRFVQITRRPYSVLHCPYSACHRP